MTHIARKASRLHAHIALALIVALVVTLFSGMTSTAWAVDLVDALGRSVHIEAEAQRIVVLPVWAEEMLLDMVGPERIAAVSTAGDDPAVSFTTLRAALIKERVSVDKPEAILALQPDLVVLDAMAVTSDQTLVQTLQDAGVNVLCLTAPTDFQTMLEALATLGQATGASAQADKMASEVKATLQKIGLVIVKMPAKNYVSAMYCENYADPSGAQGMFVAYGPGSTFDEICKVAGVINVCDAPTGSPVAKEKVTEWKPQVLLVHSKLADTISQNMDQAKADEAKTDDKKANTKKTNTKKVKSKKTSKKKGDAKKGEDENMDPGQAYAEALLADSALASVPAIADGRILSVPGRLHSTASHYMAQAALELAKMFYPIQ